jgi:hypothetical protein
VSMHLYGEGERLSLAYIPGPSLSNKDLQKGWDKNVEQCDRCPEGSEVVSIDRKENKGWGGGILILESPWGQSVCFLRFLDLVVK